MASKGGLDLKYFIQRSAILKQYRRLLKAARNLEDKRNDDPSIGRDAGMQVRQQFRSFQNAELSKSTVAVLIQQGDKSLEMMNHLASQNSGGSSSSWRPSSAPEGRPVPAEFANAPAWKGSTDPDGSDERGRVGSQWPWQKS